MGWWSATILGGDEPLDDLGNIADALGVKFDYDDEYGPDFHGYHFTRKVVEAGSPKLVALLKRRMDDSVFMQVWGAVCLWTGAKMTAKERDAVIAAAKADEWMREEGTGSERGGFIDEFIAAVRENWKGGKTTTLKDQGLFDRIAEVLG